MEFCDFPPELLGSSRAMFYSYLVSMRSVQCITTEVRILASLRASVTQAIATL
jgi:hypothetical protein